GAEDFTLSNHDTGKVPSNESQRNTTDHSVVVFDSSVTDYDSADESSVTDYDSADESSVTDYDSADESSVCSTPLPPMEKLTSVEPVYGPKTIN
ncbi:hypothetical protein Tco_0579772, partial [Tanacetum coccineum]